MGIANKGKPTQQGNGPPPVLDVTEPRSNGTWAKINDRPRHSSETCLVEKEGPKWKKVSQIDEEGEILEKEKKIKMEEETKNLSMLLASEFRSVEVVKQPRRA